MEYNIIHVEDLDKLSEDIYDNPHCINDYKMANEIIKCMADNLQEAYNWIDENEFEQDRFDLYVIGDVINLLRTIKIIKKREIINEQR